MLSSTFERAAGGRLIIVVFENSNQRKNPAMNNVSQFGRLL